MASAGGERVVASAAEPPPESGGGSASASTAGRTDGGGPILVAGDPADLVPRLWGLGIERARGELVALTASDCRPAADWVAAIERAAAERPGRAAFGGPIDPPEGGGLADWALYFARYHAFLPPAAEGTARDLPGENVAYRAAALERAWIDRGEGFWEAFVHRRLDDLGEELGACPAIRVRLACSGGLVRRARERFHHGAHYGSRRPCRSRWERWARAASAPLLPPLLLTRIGSRVARRRRDLAPRLAAAAPALLVLLSGWALGEARGYLEARPSDGAGRAQDTRADPGGISGSGAGRRRT